MKIALLLASLIFAASASANELVGTWVAACNQHVIKGEAAASMSSLYSFDADGKYVGVETYFRDGLCNSPLSVTTVTGTYRASQSKDAEIGEMDWQGQVYTSVFFEGHRLFNEHDQGKKAHVFTANEVYKDIYAARNGTLRFGLNSKNKRPEALSTAVYVRLLPSSQTGN